MPTSCVVGGCSNARNLQEGIALVRYNFRRTIDPNRKNAGMMGRLREVKTFEAEAIQDFGDLL